MEKEEKKLLEDDSLDKVSGGAGYYETYHYKAVCPVCNETIKMVNRGDYAGHLFTHFSVLGNKMEEALVKMNATIVPIDDDADSDETDEEYTGPIGDVGL